LESESAEGDRPVSESSAISRSEFMQSNVRSLQSTLSLIFSFLTFSLNYWFCFVQINRYFSNPQYYFHVNDQYVRNKLKVILFPFFHRGHWTRISEPVGGRLSYKPPIYDINAPDLYIPFMAFGSFIILAGFTLGFMGKFTPEAINLQFSRALIGWAFQLVILKGLLYSMGGGEVPLLDLVAYGGYLFAGLSLAVVARLIWAYSYYVMMPWMSLCMGVFLVRTMKRVLFTEMRSSERHSSRQHYFLLFMAIAQFPLFFWLGSIGA
jgi:hypothetical protein